MKDNLGLLFETISRDFAAKHQLFETTAKANVSKFEPELGSILKLKDDRDYLEPLAFAKTFLEMSFPDTRQHNPTLEQLLWGYSDPEHQLPEINAYVDQGGILFVPKVGYFKTSLQNVFVKLKKEADSSPPYRIYHEDQVLDFQLEKPTFIEGTSFEILQYNNPILYHLFDPERRADKVAIEDVTRQKGHHLKPALSLIQKYLPTYYQWLEKSIRRFVLFDNPEVWSFAALEAYGTAFFSVQEENELLFFIEDILHQCAHNIFFMVTLNRAEIFVIDSQQNMSTVSSDSNHPSIYGAFHGLFTMVNINSCFEVLIDEQIFSGKEEHELRGRFSSNMKRWKKGLSDFNLPEIYTEKGWNLYSMLNKVCEEIYQRKQELIEQYDTSDQPYIFNYTAFEARYPLAKENQLEKDKI